MPDRERGERAAGARQRGGDHHVEVDHAAGGRAHVLDPQLVVADRRREAAPARAEEEVERERRAERRDGGEREGGVTADRPARRQPEHGARRDVEAVGRPERRRLDQEPVEDHRERQAEHGEEDGPVAGEQHAEERRERGRRDRAEQHHRDRVLEVEDVRGQAGGVGADGVVEPLAERDEAGAHEQQQAEDDEPLPERDRDEEAGPARQQRAGDQRDRERGGEPDVGAAQRAHIFLASAATKSPRGRNASTSAITR